MDDDAVEFIGKSDDDPPIFALHVTGDAPARLLDEWLSANESVQQVEVHVGTDSDLTSDDVDSLSTKHDVAMEVRGDFGEASPV